MNTTRTYVAIFVLILLSPCFLVAQETSQRNGEARKIESFGRIPSGDFRGRVDLFLTELAMNPRHTGVVINFGSAAQIAARDQWIRRQIKFRGFESTKIRFRPGFDVGDVRTDLWIVPENGSQPVLEPEPKIAAQIRRARKAEAQRIFRRYFRQLADLKDYQGYIINYGTPAEIKLRENWIRNEIPFRSYDPPRITIVNGGEGLIRTVLWLVPPGAEVPMP